jgi:diguanylate cyclase (GGDEF)-like protein
VIADMEGFIATINHYRSQEYQIAIDDAGAGYSGLNLISDINPNYIKLDMKLIRNIDSDRLKYALVKGMVELSKTSSIYLIAEGIETSEELKTLVKLGVQYGQGYFIQKPDAQVKEINKEIVQLILEFNWIKEHNCMNNISNIYVKSICSYTGIVAPSVTAYFVYNIFKNNPDIHGLCVVENDIPIGIVTYEKLALKMSGHYGFSLNQNKPILELMEDNFLSVDYKTSISTVSYLAMSRSGDRLYDFIVVTENEKYIGTVTIRDLLQKTTEMEVAEAKNLNPLTGLPGNLSVEQKLNQCIAGGNQLNYSVAYIDIDNFKAYNDVYGFENGDLVLKLLANALEINLPQDNFIGHIGGDDFVVIVQEHIEADYFIMIKHMFEQEVKSLYHPTDIQNGYIIATSRRGEIEKFPLITLTIVVISNKEDKYPNSFELTRILAKMKRDAKQGKGILQIE